MNRIRGLRDIKTHRSLDLQGRLIGVARNMHGRGGAFGRQNTDSPDWKVEPFKSSGGKANCRANPTPVSLYGDLEEEILSYCIDNACKLLEEMRQAKEAGLRVSSSELERLQEQLARLKTGQ